MDFLSSGVKVLMQFLKPRSFLIHFRVDFNTSAEQNIGTHEEPIRCVEYCPDIGKSTDSPKSRLSTVFWTWRFIWIYVLYLLKALLHCAIWSATCNTTLKNVFVAVAEVGCYTVQRNLSNLQRFVPRKPCDIRYWRAGVGGRSDLQRNQRTLGENCVASCWRGVTLCNGSCKLLRL